MPVPNYIIDPRNGKAARVTEFEQVVTGNLDFDSVAQARVTVADTAYSLIEPENGKSIIITGLILSGNKSISATTDAVVSVYTANAIEDIDAQSGVVEVDINRSGRLVLTGINLRVQPGLFVNIKSDQTEINATIFYYRAPL